MRRSIVPCLGVLAVAVLPACGAVFPRYTTRTRPPPEGLIGAGTLSPPPESVQRVAIVEAEVPVRRGDGSDWDTDGPPDVYAVLFRNGVEVMRTPVAANTLRPTWTFAETLYLTPDTPLRVELWDEDGVLDDIVGRHEMTGMPESARNGGTWLVRMERGASLRLTANPPPPLLGAGISYELHSEYVHVLDVVTNGPAGRAGIRADDQITAINGRAVATLGEAGTRQALDRAAYQDLDLTVVRDRQTLSVRLTNDAVYPAR